MQALALPLTGWPTMTLIEIASIIFRVFKIPVKFISCWPGLFAGLEMLNPVRLVVLEADPGPSCWVNDRILEFRLAVGFSGGKEKVKVFLFCFEIFVLNSFLYDMSYNYRCEN